MENNKNHQITLPKGRIGFSSIDVSETDESKYQVRDPQRADKRKSLNKRTVQKLFSTTFNNSFSVTRRVPANCLWE